MNELISQDSLTSKRDFKVGKDVLNLHEKLTAPSNRRLTDQSLTLFNLNWSIDRITIVGFLKKFDFDHTIITEDGEIIYTAGEDFTMAQAMPILASEKAKLWYNLYEAPQRYGRWCESLYRRATGNG